MPRIDRAYRTIRRADLFDGLREGLILLELSCGHGRVAEDWRVLKHPAFAGRVLCMACYTEIEV